MLLPRLVVCKNRGHFIDLVKGYDGFALVIAQLHCGLTFFSLLLSRRGNLRVSMRPSSVSILTSLAGEGVKHESSLIGSFLVGSFISSYPLAFHGT